ncbi:MAG TPA: hypothetical protein VI522_00815, partial [Gammaproteobacteria bacterium]|nr:hypothetical protein [Gammaproteobacteria bacterium]
MPQLSKEQILFINQLTDNLTKEFELLNDALSGRAQHRASLVEKAANEINANQIGAVLLVLGVAAPVIFAIKGGALLLGRGAGYIYNRAQRSILTLVSNAYLDHTPEAGNQLI